MLIIVWLHGCIGLHFWLRLRPWYQTVQPLLLALALLLPTLALIGFADGGRELRAHGRGRPGLARAQVSERHWPDPASAAWVYEAERQVLPGFVVVLLVTFGGRGVRALRGALARPRPAALPGRRHGRDRPRHERARGEPRGRHPACLGLRRPRALLDLPGPGRRGRRAPAAAGRRRGAGAGPDRRDADASASPASCGRPTISRSCRCCRRRPGRATSGSRSIRARASSARSRCCSPTCAPSPGWPRAACPTTWCSCSTSISRRWARRSSGRAAGSTSSSATASWRCSASTSSPSRPAARRSPARARWRSRSTSSTGGSADDLREPLRIGIGLHVGPVILGEMGYGRATSLTAIGDTVNVASRLEALTKEFDVELVVSARARRARRRRPRRVRGARIEIRGRRRPLRVRLVGDARALPLDGGRRRRRARRPGPGSPASAARCGSAIVIGMPCWTSAASMAYLVHDRYLIGTLAMPIADLPRRSLLLAALLGAPACRRRRRTAGRSRAGARGRHLGQRRRGRGAAAARRLHRGAAPSRRWSRRSRAACSAASR